MQLVANTRYQTNMLKTSVFRVFGIENDVFHVNMHVIMRLNATGSKYAVSNKYAQNKCFSRFWHRKRRFSCEFARNMGINIARAR